MISVVIPAFNEEDQIVQTLRCLRNHDPEGLVKEIIVADGGSSDKTRLLAGGEGATVVISPVKSRAGQMNFGAALASQPILYFLHADTLPPKEFSKDIDAAIQNNFGAGCYRLSFDHPHWFLKANCWFTRFDVDAFRFGDQSLFIKKKLFDATGGFCQKHIVMEDQELIKRIKKLGKFVIIKKPVISSARKYLKNGIFKLQGIFFLIYFMYKLGYSQQKLLSTYKRLVKQDKL